MCLACNSKIVTPSRRSVLLGGLAALSASALPAFAQEQAAPSPDESLQRLLDGNARYVAGQRTNTDFSVGRASRALTQRPFAAILSCADSRVAPELVFDQGPGDLFVVRVAGNFVNDDGLASLEYAINFLETPLIMVLGHSNCGAVDAAIKVVRDGLALPGHLPDMIEPIRPAAEAALAQSPSDPLGLAITANVQNAVARLEAAEPILAARVNSKSLRVVGAQYDLQTGQVALL
ncbi:carbonic anhydrase [Devosia riboflavina]|uniref:Carbonic anhydrase n=1 Tax=Devosia riboflavina TaxID=46914 RepID=A0A087M4F1_9HYPH|nr:carbonic anhydrase [Devosia riboflavina]KFL31754.1 carbonic anhydrase [Devosia riboflavina]